MPTPRAITGRVATFTPIPSNAIRPWPRTEVNIRGIKFPTPISDIKKIEQQNDFSINAFGYDTTDGIVPLYCTKQVQVQHINLLLIKDNEKSHYCLIKNFSRLMAHRTAHDHTMHYCFNCLHGFQRQDLLEAHTELCCQQKPQKIEFAKKDATIKFNNKQKQLRAPFVIYADFECYTEKIDTCANNPVRTEKYQHHTPSGFSYVVVSSNPQYSRPPVLYRGNNVIDTFLAKIVDEERRITQILKNPKPLKMTVANERAFRDAQDCHICDKPLGTDRVRDHDHLTGDFRGAAHNKCNLAYKYRKVNERLHDSHIIPVVFHNLKGYDGHLLMQAIGKWKKRRLQVIPNNNERYISFSLGRLRFIDSFQFLSTSLGNLRQQLGRGWRSTLQAASAVHTRPGKAKTAAAEGCVSI